MPITHTTGTRTARDGLTLFTQHWLPEAPPRALVVLTHGIAEYSDRYRNLIDALTAASYAVFTYDLRGHGRSGGPRGSVRSHTDLLDDLGVVIDDAKTTLPNTPVVLYGHSLGGNITLNYALNRPTGLTATIASAPWLRLAFPPNPALRAVSRLLFRVWPTFTLSNPLEADALSRDTAVGQALINDPLYHPMVSPGLVEGGFAIGEALIARAGEFSIPLLVAHGSADRLTSHLATREMAQNADPSRLTYIEYDGWYHELHNEPQRDRYFDDVRAWLRDIIA